MSPCYSSEESGDDEWIVEDDIVVGIDEVRCKCGATSDDGYAGLWIQCNNDHCQFWQHG